jgi:hypothetical protein
MKKFLIGLGVVALLGFLAVMYVFSVKRSFVTQEHKIVTLQKKSQNSLSTMTNDLKSKGFVEGRYVKMLEMALDKLSSARKLNGALAVVNAIKEDNPEVSDDILKGIMNAIGGHYAKFESDQNATLDAVKILRDQTDPDNPILGDIAKYYGFPRINLDDYDKVVMSKAATKAFQTGELEAVNPFEESKAEKE